jgi:hypothetical protein
MGNHRSSTVAAICHAIVGITVSIGLLGGLTGCPTVDLGDTPTEVGLCNPAGGVQYFQDHIWPEFIQNKNPNGNCAVAGCHINGGNGLDFPGAVDYQAFYRRTQIYLNCGTPASSQLLTKPLAGVDPHGGDDIFPDLNDPAVVVFLNWFK